MIELSDDDILRFWKKMEEANQLMLDANDLAPEIDSLNEQMEHHKARMFATAEERDNLIAKQRHLRECALHRQIEGQREWFSLLMGNRSNEVISGKVN